MWQYHYSIIGKIGPFKIIGDPSRHDRKEGLVDQNNKVVISPDLGFQSFIHYRDGLLIASHPSKTGPDWMVIDYMGNPITTEGYTFIQYAEEGYYIVQRGSRSNILRRDGSFVLKDWHHRVSSIYNGYFTFGNTIRKTKSTPTRYIEGLAHVNGTIVFPLIFDSLIHESDAIFKAKYHKELYYIKNGSVFDPSKSHYPALRPADTEKEMWEKAINWMLPGLQFFYRDTDAKIDVKGQYPIGKVLRSGFFVDMSTKLLRPARKIRFIIAAAHAAVICNCANEEERKSALHFSPKFEEWNHAVLHKNTWLKVMDIYEKEGVTQILLLQIPETIANLFGNDPAFFNIMDEVGEEFSIVEKARSSLDEKLRDIIHPRSLDPLLIKRMAQPVGYASDGIQYPLPPDLTPYQNDVTLSDGTSGLSYSRYIHRLANDRDIVRDIKGFPWQGIVGSVCEGCMYAQGAGDKPFGCGRLFAKSFRANYIKGSCDFFKPNLWTPSSFEYRVKQDIEKKSKETGNYARQLLLDFIDDKLSGVIDFLQFFDFGTLKDDPKYGPLKGPSDIPHYAIIKSIMEVAFGSNWPNLNVQSMDHYLYQTGSIICDNRLVGIRLSPRNFKALKNLADDDILIDMAEELHSLKPIIGNFLVWPNKAVMSNMHETSKMRGYIDRMFIAMYEVLANGSTHNLDVSAALYKNRKLMVNYQGAEGFRRFMDDSLLNDFLDSEGKPQLLFEGVSVTARDFNPEQLRGAIALYYSFMVPFIRKRSNAIVNILKRNLKLC